MLKSITIENFKAFGDRTHVDLRPLTLLFGPNSGGKSSIIHALHFAREVMLGRGCDVHRTESGGDLVDLGGLRRLVHGRQIDGRVISLRFVFDVTETPFEYLPAVHLRETDSVFPEAAEESVSRIHEAAVTLRIPAEENAYVIEYAVELNGIHFASIRSPRNKPHSEIAALNWMHPILYEKDEYDKQFDTLRRKADVMHRVAKERGLKEIAEQIREWQQDLDADIEIKGSLADIFERSIGKPPAADEVLEVVRLPGGLPDWETSLEIALGGDSYAEREFTEFISLLVVGPGRVLCDCLQDFRYLGPLRSIPPRRLERSDPVGFSRWPHGLAAWDLLASDQKLVAEVSRWLWNEDLLDTGFRISLRNTRQVDEATILRMIADQEFFDLEDVSEIALFPGVRSTPSEPTLELEDTRRGISVDPFDVGVGLSQAIPVIVASLDHGSALVAMEQPELHLHPKQQAALGDLLIEGATGLDGRVLLVETHSEHLILRVLRRIREANRAIAPTEHGMAADQIRVLYVSQDSTSSSMVQEMNVDNDGNFIEPWPDDFFEQDFKERFS